jgi:hypothetical protein
VLEDMLLKEALDVFFREYAEKGHILNDLKDVISVTRNGQSQEIGKITDKLEHVVK